MSGRRTTFNEFFAGLTGLSAGEKYWAKGLLRHAFNAGVRGVGLANAMVDCPEWQHLAPSSQDIMRPFVVAACRAGEAL